MQFIFPEVKLIDEQDNFKRIEAAGRTCYKSEDKITEDSAYPFFQRIVKRGHTSVLEHSVIFVCTHTPEAYLWLKSILDSYIEDTGYQHYIRYSKFNNDDIIYTPITRGSSLPLGFCTGSEYLFSGNIRAWRKICERYKCESILCNTFFEHPAFKDIFEDIDDKHIREYDSRDIEIVDSIPTDPDIFPDAYKHNIATIRIIADRGLIDEWARHRVQGISIESTRYCLAGDTVLTTSNQHNKPTIEELYNNAITSKNGAWQRINLRTYNISTGEFEYANVNNVMYNGMRDCIKIKTKLGYELTCTPDHQLLTSTGYVEAGNLAVGDTMYVNGTELLYRNKDWLYYQNITLNKTFVQIGKEFGFNVSTLKKWARVHGLPKKGTGYFNVGHTPWNKGIQDQRQVEALRKYHHSGLNDTRKIIKEDTSKYMKHNSGSCAICGDTETLQVHHLDKARVNHNPENLITLCSSCHQRVHSQNLLTAYLDTIVSIENVGMQKVYDVSINSENHNFVANGVIVHNCNYSKNGVTFVFPWWYTEDEDDPTHASLVAAYGNRCYETELAYQEWIKKVNVPQMARGNLNLWVKSEGVFTATIQHWIDILALRDSPAAHPEAQKIAKMIEKVLVEEAGVKDIWGVNEQ